MCVCITALSISAFLRAASASLCALSFKNFSIIILQNGRMFGKFQTYQDVLREVVRRAILLIVDCNREALSRRRGRGVSIGSVQVRLVDHWRTQDWSFGLWLSNLQLRLL